MSDIAATNCGCDGGPGVHETAADQYILHKEAGNNGKHRRLCHIC